MTDFLSSFSHSFRNNRFFEITVVLAVAGLLAAAGSPQTVQSQPERVAERFSSPVSMSFPDDLDRPTTPDKEVAVTYSHGGTTELCLSLTNLDYDSEELFCYDGSTLRQVTNVRGPDNPSEPRDFAVYDDGSGPKLYFRARSNTKGRELFVYDGSTVSLAADINTGAGSSFPRYLTVYDGTLYYSADDGSDRELHAYDGTSDDEVADIDGESSSSSRPQFLTVYDGTLYYNADDGSDWELHAYDGSDNEVADINSGSSSGSRPEWLTVYDGRLYYSADDGSDRELHAYDGSSDNEVADINSGTNVSSDLEGLTVYDDGGGPKLYYSAYDGTDLELHAYDGTDTEIDINGSGSSRPTDLAVHDGTLYYAAYDGGDRELHAYDGTDSEVADIDGGGSNSSSPHHLTVYDDGSGAKLFFNAEGTLHQLDGGTVSELTFPNNVSNGVSKEYDKVVYNNTLYFRADGGQSGSEIWKYDGSSISQVADLNSSGGSGPAEFTVYDGKLYFSARVDGDRELWEFDGTTFQEIDINGSGDSDPRFLTVYDPGGGPKLYYSADDGTDTELHAYDGSDSEVADINGSGSSNPWYLTVYDGTLCYYADDGTDRELHVYDGSDSEVDVNPSGSSRLAGFPDEPLNLAVHDGVLYFQADGGTGNGVELWGYNGSGTSEIADINPFGDSEPTHLASYDGGLYYSAYDGSDRELHVYDGSSDSEVSDINPGGSVDSKPKSLTVFGGQLYFSATTEAGGREPHAYDGSSVSSIDLNPGPPTGGGTAPVAFDDGSSSGTDLYVTATDAASGIELYRFENDTAPLPVELAAFEAAQTGEQAVELNWTTASETSNAGFRVQHQGPERNTWSKVGFVEGEGTTRQPQSYRFSVEDLAVGTHRFRLQQRDLDGTTTVHDPVIVELTMQEALQLGAPAPNPVQDRATLSFAVKKQAETTITLYNTLGQQVRTLYRGTPPASEAQTARLETNGLSSGVYFLRLQANGKTQTQRVTVVR